MKTNPLFIVMTITVAATIVAILAQPAAWNVNSHNTAFAQSTENNTGTTSQAATIQHWEKYDFIITSPELAAKLGVSPNTELNVKIMIDPNSVVDMKQAVLDFFNANTTEADKSSIQILGAFYNVVKACPSESTQYWERIDFMVPSPELAAKLGVSPNTELNVKIVGNASSVVDMKQAVLDFFNANTTEADKSSIQILGTLNDVICTQ